MSRQAKVLIAAGGTGGHVFPALAIAQDLAANNIEVLWLGTKKGLEYRVCQENNINLFLIDVVGMRGKGLLTRLFAPFKLFGAIVSVMKLIYTTKPHCVLGMGGFVSAAGGFAAFLMRKPLLIQEQNAVAGTTNRYLARLADKIFTGFPEVFQNYRQAVYTGNPLRRSFYQSVEATAQASDKQKTLFIVGGSLGASIFNQLLPEVVSIINAELLAMQKPVLKVVHQTGVKDVQNAKALYQEYAVDAEVLSFVEDMPKAYRSASLVIARSGAMTISELAACGVASILVPYPHAIDDHQSKNADFLVTANAAIKIEQHTLNVDVLVESIRKIITDDKLCVEMAASAKQLAQVDATQKIVAACEEYVYA